MSSCTCGTHKSEESEPVEEIKEAPEAVEALEEPVREEDLNKEEEKKNNNRTKVSYEKNPEPTKETAPKTQRAKNNLFRNPPKGGNPLTRAIDTRSYKGTNSGQTTRKPIKLSGSGPRTIMRGKSASIGFKTSPGRKKK